MASEEYDDEDDVVEAVDADNAADAEDARNGSRRDFEERAKRQLRRGRLTTLAEKLSGGPERPGEQKIGRSPVVLMLVGSTIGGAILAGIFWFINASNAEERMLKLAMTSLDQKKYLDAEGQFEKFIADYPNVEATGQAKIGLHRARVEKYIVTERPDVARGLQELESMISECRDLPQFKDEKDTLRRYADRLTFASAFIAEKGQSAEALDISRKAMDRLKQYSGDDGISPERERELLNRQKLGEAAVAKKQDFVTALETVRKQLEEGRVLDAITTRNNLLIRYPLLKDDKDVARILQEILARETEFIVRTEIGRDGRTDDPNKDVPPSLALTLRTQASTDLTSQQRTIFAAGMDSCFAIDQDTGAPVWRTPIGVGSPFAPVPIRTVEPAGVLVYSTLTEEVQMLGQKDGRLLWRQNLESRPTGPPVQIADNFYFTTQAGELWQVAAANGRAIAKLKFSQTVIGPPAVSSDSSMLVIPGDQTLVYTIGVNPFKGLTVSYIPHATGSIRVPMIAAGKYYLLCDNFTADRARIQTLAMDAKQQLTHVDESIVDGQVNDPMLLRGPELFVPSTPQRVTAFRVTDETGEPPLAKVGSNQLEDGIQTGMFLLAGPGGQLWMGGRDLRKFQAKTNAVVLDPSVTAEGVHVQPIQFADEAVFLTSRSPTSNSIFFTRADREQMKGIWRTVLGSRIVALAPSATGDSLVAVADYGESYRVSLAEIAKGGFALESVSRFRLPDKLSSSVEGLVLSDGRLAAWCGSPEPSMWTFTPTGQLERKWTLPDPPEVPPVAIEGGVVFAMSGRIHITATAGGKVAEDYRSSKTQEQQQPWKSLTAISKTQVLAISGDNQFVRVEYRPSPRPQLSEISVTSVPHPVEVPPAVAGDSLFVATADGKLLLMQASSLEVISEVDLGGIPNATPKVTDDLVIVEIAGQDAQVYKAGQTLQQVGTLPLNGYGIVGSPLKTGSGYMLARADGQLIMLDAQGVATGQTRSLGQALQHGPMTVGGTTIVVGLDGSLYAVDLTK